jgi:hypothetical protein
MNECERCGAMSEGFSLHNYCELCGKNLCDRCMHEGTCAESSTLVAKHVPATESEPE